MAHPNRYGSGKATLAFIGNAVFTGRVKKYLQLLLVVSFVAASPIPVAADNEPELIIINHGDLSPEQMEQARVQAIEATSMAYTSSPAFAGGRLTDIAKPGSGLVAVYEPEVPDNVRVVVDAVMADMDSVIAFNPNSPVEIAVRWTSEIASLGLGGTFSVRAGGSQIPATLADTLYGRDHTPTSADGFLLLSSQSPESYNYDPNADTPDDKWSLYSLVAHELTHALGFAMTLYGDYTFRQSLFSAHLRFGPDPIDGMNANRLREALAAEQDIEFDLGNGGTRIPMYSPAEAWTSTLSHTAPHPDVFNRTVEPGDLMDPSLSNGLTHSIDGPILGILETLGWPMRVAPSAPTNLAATSDGTTTTVSWNIDLAANAAPATSYRIDLISNRQIMATTTVPAGNLSVQLAMPFAATDAVKATPINRAGKGWAATTLSPAGTLMNDATTVEQIPAAADFIDAHADVLRLYFAFFDRNPDAGGARYWILDIYDAGNSLDVIADNFAVSEEFNNTYGNTTNREFLQVVYANVLGREFDQAGFDYWLDTLEGTNYSGANAARAKISRGAVVRWITASNEFKSAHPY